MPDVGFDEEGFLSYSTQDTAWGRKGVLQRLPLNGGRLYLPQTDSTVKAILTLEEKWGDKDGERLRSDIEPNAEWRFLYFTKDGKREPVAKLKFIKDSNQKVQLAFVEILPVDNGPDAVKDFAETILENLEKYGLAYANPRS